MPGMPETCSTLPTMRRKRLNAVRASLRCRRLCRLSESVWNRTQFSGRASLGPQPKAGAPGHCAFHAVSRSRAWSDAPGVNSGVGRGSSSITLEYSQRFCGGQRLFRLRAFSARQDAEDAR